MFVCEHSELSLATSSDWETVCADCEEVVDMGKRQGRPATERGAYNPNPARQLGRISDEDWSELKEAADAAGQSMVEWALPTLLKKARRESKKAK
jgi:hypothetical protein